MFTESDSEIFLKICHLVKLWARVRCPVFLELLGNSIVSHKKN